MPRRPEVYLEDMLEAIGAIREYVVGLDRQSFGSDRRTTDAVVRNLEVLGEAAGNVPEEVRSQYPAIDWRGAVRLRNVLIHRYFGVDLDIVWDVATNELVPLAEALREALKDLEHGRRE